MKITVQTTVRAPIERVWEAWTTPADIVRWNAASDDWHTPYATNDVREGGLFSWRMEARDGSVGFDFAGRYTRIVPNELIEYTLGDERLVTVEFIQGSGDVTVIETFDTEEVNDADLQRRGWQAILDRFKSHVEST